MRQHEKVAGIESSPQRRTSPGTPKPARMSTCAEWRSPFVGNDDDSQQQACLRQDIQCTSERSRSPVAKSTLTSIRVAARHLAEQNPLRALIGDRASCRATSHTTHAHVADARLPYRGLGAVDELSGIEALAVNVHGLLGRGRSARQTLLAESARHRAPSARRLSEANRARRARGRLGASRS